MDIRNVRGKTLLGADPITTAFVDSLSNITKPGAQVNKTVIYRDTEADNGLPSWLPWAGVGVAAILAFMVIKK